MRRRDFLRAGGIAAALPLIPRTALAGPVVEIAMAGRPDGSRVWFDPFGVLIRPGQTLRWTNLDKANSHTATAYAPENDDHPRRIPEGAAAFDSGYLLPGDSFEVTFSLPGVYDYYCIPHERAGMVGRIVVAEAGQGAPADYPGGDLDPEVLAGFAPVADILAQGALYHEEP